MNIKRHIMTSILGIALLFACSKNDSQKNNIFRPILKRARVYKLPNYSNNLYKFNYRNFASKPKRTIINKNTGTWVGLAVPYINNFSRNTNLIYSKKFFSNNNRDSHNNKDSHNNSAFFFFGILPFYMAHKKFGYGMIEKPLTKKEVERSIKKTKEIIKRADEAIKRSQ